MKPYQNIIDILNREYDLSGHLTEMVAYEDLNYRLETPDGKKFVVKITMNPDERDFALSQNQVLLDLSGNLIPKPLPTKSGNYHVDITISGVSRPLRVLSYIEGDFLGEVKPDIAFFSNFGNMLGHLNRELESMANPVLKCHSHEWDLARFQELKPLADFVSDPEIKRLVLFFFMRHREEVIPVYHQLPKGLIHSDANEWNVLVEGQKAEGKGQKGKGPFTIKGLIDFGDMVYSARVHEIAIALAYSLNADNTPVTCAGKFVGGYNHVNPLSQLEISLLYYLIAARLSTIIVQAARKSHEQPNSEYHQISAAPAQKLLKAWIRINPLRFEKELMNTCGIGENTDKTDYSDGVARKIAKRQQFFSQSQSLSYSEPIEMIGSALQYMYGSDGKTYLDCVNNIPHVGHCHPKVVEAGQKQMATLNTNTRYVYDSLNDYAEKLLAKFPDSLSKVFFVNSGSAATDLAIRLAKTHTKREKFQVLDCAYHGNISSAIELSPYKFNRAGGSGRSENVDILRLEASGFRLKYKDEEEALSNESPNHGITESRNHGITESPNPRSFAAFIAESLPGCAGQVVLDKAIMQERVNWIREQGGIYIADEVQNGFARVGTHFWGFELYNVVPDIVILGKPIANGHPMGAVVCTDEIAKSFETGMEFFSSFGGNPVSCEIAKAVLDVIEDEGLQAYAREVGEFLISEIKSLIIRHSSFVIRHSSRAKSAILEVRGSGLFLGIEFVKNLETKEPDPEAASNIVNSMKEKGFLLSTDGPYENVIKFKPPMCFSMENAKELLAELRLTIDANVTRK
ncbi:MAG: aminotransferase class III-fold pyridoxal phosphate-dependent enzyme [Bacteroidota bacterium]|nr:aminotransferase class III-fold pyridoxal phosphate-dependent enzyme [Bacteroidota bacterium]